MPDPSPRRLLKALFVLSLLVAVAVGGWAYVRYHGFADSPIAIVGTERILTVEPGDGFRDILGKLRALGVAEGHDLEWQALAHDMQVVSRLQVGDYAIRHGITPRQLLEKLESGKVIQHRFTIVEGWSLRELRAALAKDPTLKPTLADTPDDALMAALGRDDAHPEGRFLPETYHYTRGMSDRDVLARAALAMDKALADAWAMRAPDSPLKSPDELLVLASIVEKETGKASERAEIAGVFTRRLVKGMLLQTDPTVIYGMGERFAGQIRKKDLETDTPYNTYTRGGLPPTPIALPGIQSLNAALAPEKTPALYFVSRGDGTSQFSDNLPDHNRAVNQYQRKITR